MTTRQFEQYALIAVSTVTSYQLGTAIGIKLVEQSTQSGFGVCAAVLFARSDLYIENQTQVTHPLGVQDVTGSPRLVRVVA